ncbi:hypothetical protein JCM1840_003817 [Sporobolomyces johnsonii]
MEPFAGQRDWSAVTVLLDRHLATARAENPAGSAELEYLETCIWSIVEGFRPVWNAQSPQVQDVVITALSLPPDFPLPSLQDLISYSNARWAENFKTVICTVTDIPKPEKSAFRRPEFESVMDCFQRIVSAAPRGRNIGNFRARVNSLQSVLFRSWEALSEAEIQAAVYLVGHYDTPDRQGFVKDVIKKAVRFVPADAAVVIERYPLGFARHDAQVWWSGLHHDLTLRWKHCNEPQRKTVCDFMQALREHFGPPLEPAELVCSFLPYISVMPQC